MMKHYKILLFGLVVFAIVGITPKNEPKQLRTKIVQRVIEVPPNDLKVLEENSRQLYEYQAELQWLADSE